MVNNQSVASSKGDSKNTASSTGGKTLGQLGIDVGADALFVQDGMIAYLDKNIEYQEAGEHMVLTLHAKLPDGSESKVRRKLAPYLLERCAQAVTRWNKGWFRFTKEEKGARSYYTVLPCDEKGTIKPEALPKKK